MLRNWVTKYSSLLAFAILLSPTAFCQETASTPPPYRGVEQHIAGVFVTPVPNLPFTATVEVESSQTLPDGSIEQKKTFNNIARDSAGRIYNERRTLVPPSFDGTPRIVSMHLYDPQNRMSTFMDPSTHIARESVLAKPEVDPTRQATNSSAQGEDLGSDTMENVQVRGSRKSKTIPAQFSGTGQAIVVIDEYWYSEDLHLNMLVKHNDPRTGEQTVTVTHVNRGEPDQTMFQVPSGYKIVDETPVSQ
jgi:hypothetical protein